MVFSADHYEIIDEKTMKFRKCIKHLNEAGTYFCKQNVTKADNFSGQVVRVESKWFHFYLSHFSFTQQDWVTLALLEYRLSLLNKEISCIFYYQFIYM